MDFQHVPLAKLAPAPYNPRVDLAADDPALVSLRGSIDRFDCVEPIVWNRRTGHVVGGHQRLKVLEARGDESAPCVVVELDPDEERVLNLALNRIDGRWDEQKLADVVRDLAERTDADALAHIGFDDNELAALTALDEPLDLNLAPAEPDLANHVDVRVGADLCLLPRELVDRLKAVRGRIAKQVDSTDPVAVVTFAITLLEEELPA